MEDNCKQVLELNFFPSEMIDQFLEHPNKQTDHMALFFPRLQIWKKVYLFNLFILCVCVFANDHHATMIKRRIKALGQLNGSTQHWTGKKRLQSIPLLVSSLIVMIDQQLHFGAMI